MAQDLLNSIPRHVPKENPQSTNHHAQHRNPSDQKLAKGRLFRRAPCLGQDGEVGAAMWTYFCRFIDLFVALVTGVHRVARNFQRHCPKQPAKALTSESVRNTTRM